MRNYSFNEIFFKLKKYCTLDEKHTLLSNYKQRKYLKFIEMSRDIFLSDENKSQFLICCESLNSSSRIERKIITDVLFNNVDKIDNFFKGEFGKNYLGFDAIKQLLSLNILTCKESDELKKYWKLFEDIYAKTPNEVFNISSGNCALRNIERLRFFESALKANIVKPNDVEECIRVVGITYRRKNLIGKYSKELISVSTTPIKNLRQLKKMGLDSEEIREIIDSREDAVLKEMCGSNEIFKLMIKEVIKRENVRLSDIHILGMGAYSKVFEIGSKAIKLGENAEEYHIKRNSKRFLHPIVRFQNSGERIEILEKVDIITPITEDELYEVYRDVRKDGMIWTDVKYDNVGRLTKENIVHLANYIHLKDGSKVQYNIVPYGPNLGFDEDTKISEPLSAGDVVILDLDFIFPEDSDKIIWPNSLGKTFEYRYQKECKAKNEGKIKEIKIER